MDEHDEVARLHGPWSDRGPVDVRALFVDYRRPWWIAGGWAIEAFTGASRPHGDVDVGIVRSDAPALQDHLAGRYDVWAADRGTLRPLVERAGLEVPPTCVNLWLRRSGADPWDFDVLLTDVSDAVWTYRRDRRVHRLLAECLVERGGIPYLGPEVQLLHKAPGRRAEDEADFAACLPLLDSGARTWLAGALRLAHPEHPWIDRLETGSAR